MSGGGSKAPAGYQPTGQPQADQNYQNLVSGAMPWAQGLPSSVIPGLQGVVSATQNNPYYGQAQAGAGTAAQQGAQTAAYQQQGGLGLYGAGTAAGSLGASLGQQALGLGGASTQLGNLAQLSAQNAILRGQQVFNAGQTGNAETQGLIPSTTQGANYAPGQLGQADMLANLTASGALGAIPGLTQGMGAANSVLNTAFDPQSALYNRTYQQIMDQQNAINAASGVATSPYGAGVAGQTAENFNIDWQNQQLQRQIAGLGAYGQEQGQVANNLTNLLGSAAGNYANLTNAGASQYTGLTSNAAGNLSNLVNTGVGALGTGANAYNQGMNTWLNGVNTSLAANAQGQNAITSAGNLYNQGLSAMGGAYGQGSQLGIDALQTGLAASLAPSQTYLGNENAIQNALLALSAGGSQSLGPTNNLINAEGQYLNIGQNATSLAQNAAQINNAQANAQAAGIGNLVGTVAAVALAPATGGLSLFALGGEAGSAGVKAYGG